MTAKVSIVSLALCLLAAPIAFAQGAPDEAAVKRGRTIFSNKGCSACHAVGKAGAGPDLAGVSVRRTREWLGSFLKDTDQMLNTDSTAMALLKQFKGTRMPAMSLPEADVDAVLAFIASQEAKLKK